jgi:hypothetical protein
MIQIGLIEANQTPKIDPVQTDVWTGFVVSLLQINIAVCTPAIAIIQDRLFTVQNSGTSSQPVNFRNVTDGSIGTNSITIIATSSNPACISDPVIIYTRSGKTSSLVLNLQSI